MAPLHCSCRLAMALFLVLAALAPPAVLATSQSAVAMFGANPVRKVITLLEKLHDKMEEEGRREEKLYEKFKCYCEKNKAELESSVKALEEKLPPMKNKLEANLQEKVQLQSEIKKAKADRDDAYKELADATAIREKEEKIFAETSSEQEQTIAAIDQAVEALTKGMGEASTSFLQTNAAETLRRIVVDKDGLLDGDRQALLSFLDTSHGSSSHYVPRSGEILGILKQMGEETRTSLAEAKAAEADALKEFRALKLAKQKEIKALSATIEKKTELLSELGVEIVQLKADVEDTQDSLDQDTKYLAALTKSCDKKALDYDERTKMRAEELKALDETHEILNDDNTLETVKKALPGATSFLQVSESASAVKARALSEIRRQKDSGAQGHSAGMDMIFMALRGKKIGFEKVIKMIEGMKKTLHSEQDADDKKKEYCGKEFDSTGDKKEELTLHVQDKATVIESATQNLAVLEDEIKVLTDGIKKLDEDVAEATDQRKKENEEYTQVMSDNSAAKQLLNLAKNRMNQFYNPSMAGEGEGALVQEAEGEEPPPPPETYGDFKTQSGGSMTIISLLDTLIKDIEKQMVEAKTEEKYAQKDYQELMQDSRDKRSADSKSLSAKTLAKGDLDEDLQAAKEEKASTEKELAATEKLIVNLHTECDWLLNNFEVRKEARSGEIESLDRAKAVLNGADYSFSQRSEEGQAIRSHGFLAQVRPPRLMGKDTL